MRFISILFLSSWLVACHQPSSNTLKIGTISGPETELVEVAKDVALKKYGLSIKIIEFNDYNLPNEALEDGSLDANVYQHKPYLEAAMKAHHYHFEIIGKTFVYPAGIYSKKHKSLNDLPMQAIVAIPNDPSNEARALTLLNKAGLITLKSSQNPTLNDITSNPKKLKLTELDAAQLPRVLPDVDLAIINTTFALPAGLSPSQDALFLEDKDSPYANLIVINIKSNKKDALARFVKALQSDEVKNKAKNLFGNAAIPAWD